MPSFTARNTEHPAVFARISLLGDTFPPRRIGLELRFDHDARFRWYEEATGKDTEVSSRNIDLALQVTQAWPMDPWETAVEWVFYGGSADPGPYQA